MGKHGETKLLETFHHTIILVHLNNFPILRCIYQDIFIATNYNSISPRLPTGKIQLLADAKLNQGISREVHFVDKVIRSSARQPTVFVSCWIFFGFSWFLAVILAHGVRHFLEGITATNIIFRDPQKVNQFKT